MNPMCSPRWVQYFYVCLCLMCVYLFVQHLLEERRKEKEERAKRKEEERMAKEAADSAAPSASEPDAAAVDGGVTEVEEREKGGGDGESVAEGPLLLSRDMALDLL